MHHWTSHITEFLQSTNTRVDQIWVSILVPTQLSISYTLHFVEQAMSHPKLRLVSIISGSKFLGWMQLMQQIPVGQRLSALLTKMKFSNDSQWFQQVVLWEIIWPSESHIKPKMLILSSVPVLSLTLIHLSVS